jgi:hypothetical protein
MAAKLPNARSKMEQKELYGVFYDEASDHPGKSFQQITKRVLGRTAFPTTANGQRFEQELRFAYELARPAAPRKSLTIATARKGK